MITRSDLKNLGIKFVVILGLWLIVVLLIASVTIVQTIQEGSPVHFFGIILFEFVCISPWIICTPAIVWLARSYRFNNGNLLKSSVVHLLGALFVFSIHCIVQSSAVFYYYDIPFSWSYFQTDFFGFMDMRVILYIGILLITYVIDFQKKNRAIRLRKSKLKAELSKAKFHALLNQIQPDFLLKTIDAMHKKLDQDIEEAEEILTNFSDLLRIMLNSVSREETIVRQDLEAYSLYVSILSKRLNKEIEKENEIDPNCYKALVPSFLLLIPLFEQIIQTPEFNKTIIKRIAYNALHESDSIILTVNIEGDNIGAYDMNTLSQKSGLPEIVKNLRIRYGQDVKFEISSQDDLIHVGLKMPYIIEGISMAIAE